MRPRFRDGAAILPDYDWEIGHWEEQGQALTHNIERTATTDGVGLVRQQGDPSPELLRFQGTILTQDQYDKMRAYWAACTNRTVFYRDYTGVEYEVIVTAFDPQRVPVLKNLRDPSIMHYWRYSIEMEVIA